MILTDSLSSLKSIESKNVRNRAELVNKIHKIISDLWNHFNIKVTLLYTPAHVGIKGNEKADYLAKKSLRNEHINIITNLSINEFGNVVKSKINDEWQKQYENSEKGNWLRRLDPVANRKLKMNKCEFSRRDQKVLTRL